LYGSGVLEGQPEKSPPDVKVTWSYFRFGITGPAGYSYPVGIAIPIGIQLDFGMLRMSHSGAGAGNHPQRDPATWTSDGNNKSVIGTWVCDAILRMISAIESYNASPVKYWPGGPNSNSTVRYLLEAGGLSGYFTVPPNTVGWGVPVR
jgi:hypothetical protein